jgi:2,5-furandicarboxylate decarboxylase 1
MNDIADPQLKGDWRRRFGAEPRQSLRMFLAALDAAGQMAWIAEPVNAEFEIAASLAQVDAGPALGFEQVSGYRMPIIGNVLNSLPRIAAGLGTTAPALQRTIIAAIEAPLAHRVIGSASCQEEVIADPALAEELPVPRFFEHERGRYITAGAIVAKDRRTGQTNLSIARVMPLGGNRAFVGIAPNHHLAALSRQAHARGETLDIAVTIGNHPAVLVASCLYLGLGEDELKVAGALMGEPLHVVRCIGSDLLVPARCECVLEGTLDAGERIEEGPVSEFHGLYEDYGAGIVATFTRLTRRRDALFQVVLPGYHPEHCLLGGVAIAAGLARSARLSVPAVKEVAVGMGGAGRLHAVVSLSAPRPGDARKAVFAIWASVNLIKQIVVVDDDVDPWDGTQVEWAIATRMKPDRDLIIVPGVRADRSEPLETGGTVAKLAIDATRRDGDRSDWTKARPPIRAVDRARELLRDHLASRRGQDLSSDVH